MTSITYTTLIRILFAFAFVPTIMSGHWVWAILLLLIALDLRIYKNVWDW